MTIVVLGLAVAGCGRADEPSASAQPAEPQASVARVYAGEGRDRLCVNERDGSAAFITYGDADTNCTARGALKRDGESATLIPDGDQACQIALTTSGGTLRLGPVSSACAYYCGPTASFEGAEFWPTDNRQSVTDLAGAPLC